MYRNLSSLFIALGLALLAAGTSAYADDVIIAGKTVSESGSPLERTIIKVNGRRVRTDASGHFSAKIQESDIYSIDIRGRRHFPIIQTFSHYELATAQENSDGNTLTIPIITLVAKETGRVMLAFGGDAMMGRRYFNPLPNEAVLIHPKSLKKDTRAIVEHVAPYLKLADYASINLETQILKSEPGSRAPKSITFYSPPETLKALSWAGVDYVTLGNNHTFDYVDEGLEETLKHMKRSKLGYSGAGTNEEEALAAHRTKINKTPYSFLGYVGWQGGFSPNQTAGKNKGGAAWGSMDNVRSSVKREADAGYNTVAQLHAGLEYADEPSGSVEYRLKAAIDEGAAIAIGHHTHVTQGFELYKDRLVAYSLGNFAFDQSYHDTQPTYLLYVWMDGERFHRAEIVPLYVKGYKPTPATGAMRNYVLRRVDNLSYKRGLSLGTSGGHAVITASEKSPAQAPTTQSLTLTKSKSNEQVISLNTVAWQDAVVGVNSNGKARYRLGRDILNRGNFEAHYYFDAPDRTWFFSNSASGISDEKAHSGKRAMKLAVPANQTTWSGMAAFKKVFTVDNPNSLSGYAFAEADTTLKVYVQGRKNRQSHMDALEKGRKILLGEVAVPAGQWMDFSVDFVSPRVGIQAYRVLLEAVPADKSKDTALYLDDIALIEWQTAHWDASDRANVTVPNQITHVGITAADADKAELVVERR